MSDRNLKRPSTERVRVEDLVLYDVPEGKYRIPPFQRPWRWTRDDVLDLFDSLWRGFPIGVLLCWIRPGPAETIGMGEFEQPVAERHEAKFIIDGQQRVRALVGVLRHPEHADLGRRGSDFELYFDLSHSRFCHRDAPGPPAETWLPMNVVADSASLAAWLDERKLRTGRPELYRLALELGRMVREHELLLYVLDTDDEAAIRQLFARLNNTGRRLKETEVFDALHRDMGGPIDDLDHLVLEVADRGFGALSQDRLLQVCLAVVGAEFKRRLQGRLHRAPPDGAQLVRVKPALFGALSLLRDAAGLPTGADLPHALGLCATAILFDRFKTIDARNAELLSRFIWRGTVTDALNGRNQELSARVYRAVRDEGSTLSDCVQRLLETVPRTAPPPLSVERWRPTHGLTRLMLLALEAQGPRDLRSGRALSPEDLRPEGGPLATVKILGSSELADDRWRQSLGNVLLHPKVAGLSRVGSLVQDLGRTPLFVGREAPILASHGISPEAWDAFRSGDFARFVARREAVLAELIDAHIAQRASWDPPDRDRPPIATLVEGLDDDQRG